MARPDTLEVLATAPARLWSQQEQALRYAHEPGELENTAEALWGPAWRDHVHEIANNHAVLGVFTTPAGGTVVNVGVTDWAYGLDGSGRRPDHAQRPRPTGLSPQVPVEPGQHQLEALHPVRRASRSG